MLRDTTDSFGFLSRFLHWGMAVAIFSMFGLGWWMTGLDYYSPYYKSAPDLHRSIGMVLLVVLLFRWFWRVLNVRPADVGGTRLEIIAARIVHNAFYPLLLALMVTGYFISTLDGRSIDVFATVSIPSIIQAKGWEEVAGAAHEFIAYLIIGLSLLHAAAAIKHQWIDGHRILTRMWTGDPATPSALDE